MAPAKAEADDQLEALFRASPSAIVSFDTGARITRWSPSAESLFGWTAQEVHGRLPPFVPKDRWPEFEAYFEKALSGASWTDLAVCRQRKDGSPLELSASTAPIRDRRGRVTGVVSVIVDVGERTEAARRLQESEERYRHLFENANDCVGTIDLDWNVTSCNRAFGETLGYTRDELLARNVRELLPTDQLKHVEESLRRKVAREAERTTYDLEFQTKDGSTRVLEMATQLIEKEGTPVGAEAIARDVTERRQAEEALRESEARYRCLFENASDCIATVDLQWRITSANGAFEKAIGYRQDELLGRNVREFLPEHSLKIAEDQFGRKLGGYSTATTYPLDIRAKDGSYVTLEISTQLIEEEGTPIGAEMIGRDVTDRARLEEQLRQVQKLEAIGRLAGGIAHDFNNLLTAIVGHGELLRLKLQGNAEQEQELDQILRAADHAGSLTRQLLAFSRRQVLKPRTLDLNAVVTDIETMLRRLIGEDIEVVAMPHADQSWVRADPGQLEQVIINLGVNARDAMPEGGTLTIETADIDVDAVSAARHPPLTSGQYVLLTVCDTGVGMDSDTQAQIFEPFFTTKEKGKGTGLGLATVYGIVKQSGGFIFVSSEAGIGTTFDVYLPRAAEPAPTSSTVVGGVQLGSETVLLVEDDEVVRGLVRRTLEHSGYCVLEARDGSEALKVSKRYGDVIHLLLTDLVMPNIGGQRLAELLQETRPETTTLFMSGYTDEAAFRTELLEPGAAFLQKPFTLEDLMRKVGETMAGESGTDPSSGLEKSDPQRAGDVRP